MNYTKGSTWRKWDLHIHTPYSITHNYSGETERAWDKFLHDLEALPSEFKVIGINDYIFIDGYKRVLAEKQAGRLSNIDLILPVIELRLDKFGGSESSLKRVNFHIIFSDQVMPEVIEQQFLNALPNKYQLSPEYEHVQKDWCALATRESLTDLGSRIVESMPVDKRPHNIAAVEVGFNNINFSLNEILGTLGSHYFKDKHLTAVGKNEWADIKWNNQSIADKKNIINKVDLVFISAKTVQAYTAGKKQLLEAGVNSKLLDCSDAHHFSNSSEPNRIGKCFTWIKADPTFEGLKHALKEADERVYVGQLPDKIISVENNKTKYIKSIDVRKKLDSKLGEVWFDAHLEFNHELVAIIGNKGMAKSALTDIVGLLGNTKNCNNFSFLTSQKFKEPSNNKAQHFQATLTWESGVVVSKRLDEISQPTDPETVKYIPQHFFESVCNELANQKQSGFSNYKDSSFDKELKDVIFSHVPTAERLGKNSLDELIAYKTSETNEAITSLKNELEQTNAHIVLLEERTTPEYRQSIESQLEARKVVLKLHRESKPAAVPSPDSEHNKQAHSQTLDAIQSKKLELESLDKRITEINKKKAQIAQSVATTIKALDKIENFKRTYNNFKRDCSIELEQIDISFDSVVKLELNDNVLREKQELLLNEQKMLETSLDTQSVDSLGYQRLQIKAEISKLQNTLDEAGKSYQSYLKTLERWKRKDQEIIGNKDTLESIKYFEHLLANLDKIPSELLEAKRERLRLAQRIYSKINKLAQTYKELYKPVQDFIREHPLAKDKFSLNFDVVIVNKGFKDRFFEWVSHGISGSFCGAIPGKKLLDDIIVQHDFNNEESTLTFLESVTNCLLQDKSGNPVQVGEQLKRGKSVESLYDFIYSLEYLSPHYVLKMGDKELHQLSPGEKGALLLIFYLLVDKNDIPLIIDQPEENLDNQTIVDLLVPSIKKAKKKRQIFIVTHNPNLAVVCDAEQVIYAFLDKQNLNKVEYLSGSIENPPINKKVIDVLEGTRLAFDNRNSKYFTSAP